MVAVFVDPQLNLHTEVTGDTVSKTKLDEGVINGSLNI